MARARVSSGSKVPNLKDTSAEPRFIARKGERQPIGISAVENIEANVPHRWQILQTSGFGLKIHWDVRLLLTVNATAKRYSVVIE
jgi:hypothetical protein